MLDETTFYNNKQLVDIGRIGEGMAETCNEL